MEQNAVVIKRESCDGHEGISSGYPNISEEDLDCLLKVESCDDYDSVEDNNAWQTQSPGTIDGTDCTSCVPNTRAASIAVSLDSGETFSLSGVHQTADYAGSEQDSVSDSASLHSKSNEFKLEKVGQPNQLIAGTMVVNETDLPAETEVHDFRHSLLQLQKDGYLCDTVLIGDNGEVRAHGVVLAASSSVFKDTLKSEEKPTQHTIIMPGLKRHMLEIAVTFAYTENVIVPEEYASPGNIVDIVKTLKELGFDLSSMEACLEELMSAEDARKMEAEHVADRSVSCYDDDDDGVDDDDDVVVVNESDMGVNDFDACKVPEVNAVGVEEDEVHVKKEPKRKDKSRKLYGKKSSVDECTDELAKSDSLASSSSETSVARSSGRVCHLCGRDFNSGASYLSHMKSHDKDNRKPAQCNVCGLQCRYKENLRRHMLQHTGYRRHLCQHCGESFIQRQSLQDHIARYHPDKLETDSDVRKMICKSCGGVFYSSYLFRRHAPCGDRPVRRHRSTVDTRTYAYACQRCNKRFRWQASLLIHENFKCIMVTNGGCRQPRSRQDPNDEQSADVMCAECGKVLSSRQALETHRQNAHSNDKPFKCPLCDWHTADDKRLLYHVLVHTGEAPWRINAAGGGAGGPAAAAAAAAAQRPLYKCCMCGLVVEDREQLRAHRLTHAGEEKPFTCTVCGKRLTQRAHLTNHMRMHTGEKPFQCRMCSKAYRQKTDLRIHYRQIHQYDLPKRQGRSKLDVDIDDDGY